MESPPSHNGLFEAYNAAVRKAAGERGLAAVSFPVRRGDVVVWDASTLHGGMPHLDRNRSRHSFVMHVTPPTVSVSHMQYFFHPERPLPLRAPWPYLQEGGRQFAMHENVGFMHRFHPALGDFTADAVLTNGG
jgi:ectoine hydroxylase-related dioxygenase (phytanoyl-CoA dioxygenase family)